MTTNVQTKLSSEKLQRLDHYHHHLYTVYTKDTELRTSEVIENEENSVPNEHFQTSNHQSKKQSFLQQFQSFPATKEPNH